MEAANAKDDKAHKKYMEDKGNEMNQGWKGEGDECYKHDPWPHECGEPGSERKIGNKPQMNALYCLLHLLRVTFARVLE